MTPYFLDYQRLSYNKLKVVNHCTQFYFYKKLLMKSRLAPWSWIFLHGMGQLNTFTHQP